MSSPGIVTIQLQQGAAYNDAFIYKNSAGVPINLTGYTAKMWIRPYKTSPDAYLFLTTSNGGLTITAAEGKITPNVTTATAATLDFSKAVYFLYIYSSGGEAEAIAEGYAKLNRANTADVD